MKIFSDDGNMFATQEEALAYEERQRQHASQKIARFQEVEEAHQHYLTLLEKYNYDYKGDVETARDRLWQQLISLYD